MRTLSLILLSIFLANAMMVAPSLAAEETPITKWITAENQLLDTLPKQNQKVFFLLRNKHSVIRSIYMVRNDIGSAVKACAKNNKEIRKSINGRYAQWEKSIMPILKESEKHLKKELKEQEAFFMTDYKYVMALNDKAYKFSESQIKKTPVTTLDSCEKLVGSMDRTEDKLISLLQEILLPEEVMRSRAERS